MNTTDNSADQPNKELSREEKDALKEEAYQQGIKDAGELAVKVLKEVTGKISNSEARPEQEQATSFFAKAIKSCNHVLVEAPTGTGKSLAYLVPAVVSGEKIVISTATKQLSEQIINKDVPFLKKALKESESPVTEFKAALLKGRDNYFCHYKEAESSKLDGQLDVATSKSDNNKIAVEIRYLKAWADKTKTGDRAEAPDVVSDKIWRQYSSNSGECLGRNTCPFGSTCFAEIAKDNAKDADIVVTNHALVANDLISEQPNFSDRSVFIFDEIHELDNYFSNAWGATLTPNLLKDVAKNLKPVEDMIGLPVDEFSISVNFNKNADMLKKALELVESGLISTPEGALKHLLADLRVRGSEASTAIGKKMADKNANEDLKTSLVSVRKKLDNVIESVDMLMSDTPQIVKWISEVGDDKQLSAAPLRVGPKLQSKLHDIGATMIGTSATITVAGSFAIPLHNLGLDQSPNVKTVALPSPFDFKQQSMMYIPDDSFPTPVGKDRKEHGEAVKAVSYELIKAMNGRALVLTTTSYGVRDISEYLRKKLPDFDILAQGDMPNSQLVEKFREDEHSVLVATMGLWHGLDIQGSTSSLLIIDKIPFKPLNDPLFQARREYADSQGRDGFMDIFVADANVMLTQGVGRLIRSKTDKGVVAILDNRLLNKGYGRQMLQSMPKMSIFRDKGKVVGALERLSAVYAKEKDNPADS